MTRILPITLARIFDREQIGINRQVFLVVGTAINVLLMGFTTSAFYYLPRETKRRGLIVLNIVVYLAGVGLLCGGTIAWSPGLKLPLSCIVQVHSNFGPMLVRPHGSSCVKRQPNLLDITTQLYLQYVQSLHRYRHRWGLQK